MLDVIRSVFNMLCINKNSQKSKLPEKQTTRTKRAWSNTNKLVITEPWKNYGGDVLGRNYSSKTFEPRLCKNCGKIFTPKHWRAEFCDNVCQRSYQVKQYRKRHLQNTYNLLCRTCGKTFKSTRPNVSYCSDQCRAHKPKKNKETKTVSRFVYNKNLCPNPACNWKLDCGGGKTVCLRAKCNHGIVFT